MVDFDLVRHKISHIDNNLSRLKERSKVTLKQLTDDLDIQDIILHNLQLAIQACMDIGSHIIADESWEMPNTLGEIFSVLQHHNVISSQIEENLKPMVGFRNILIHEYQEIDLEKVYDIITNHLVDFNKFRKEIINYYNLH